MANWFTDNIPSWATSVISALWDSTSALWDSFETTWDDTTGNVAEDNWKSDDSSSWYT